MSDEYEDISPKLRPVLEALQRIGGFMSLSPRDYWDELGQSCRAALASDAGTDAGATTQGYRVAGEPVSDKVGAEFGRLIAERDALRDAQTRKSFMTKDWCLAAAEQEPPGVAEVEAFHRRAAEVGHVQALRELDESSAAPPTNAPDAELDRLLTDFGALMWDRGRGRAIVPNDIPQRKAIHAYVERVKREAQGAEFIAGAEDAERRIAMLLADDGCAASHQTIGQYRASLLRVLRSNTATTSTAPDSSPAARPAPARSNHPEQSI